MADSLRFVLDFAAKTAGLKDAAALADLLGDELDDTTDAGKAMAAALAAAAAKAEKDLADTVEMADKLGAALGPELSGKVNLDQIAADMRAVGMTTEQVDANIDSFRASLASMAQTADQVDARLGSLDTSVRRVGDTTDRSRSVMANYAGNALQEVPLLSGAFGPLNMAIGQFGEYAAEGNIKLKNLLATGAGIGAVTFLMSQFADRAERAAKADAFDKDEVKAYASALKGTNTAMDAVLEKLRAGEGIMLNWGDVGGQKDVTGQLVALGLTAEQTAKLIAGGADDIEAWRVAMEESGASVASTEIAAAALTQQSTYLASSQENAARSAKFFGDETDTAAGKTDGLARKLRETGRAWDDFTGRFDKDDTLANAVLELEGLDEKLADIRDRLGKGEITDREAWAESTLAINNAKDAAFGLLEEFGNLSPALAQEIEVLINTGRIDEAIAKMVELRRLTDAANALGSKAWSMVSGVFGGGNGSPAPAAPTGSGAHASAPPNVTVNVHALNATAETGRLVADSLAAHYRTGGQRP